MQGTHTRPMHTVHIRCICLNTAVAANNLHGIILEAGGGEGVEGRGVEGYI